MKNKSILLSGMTVTALLLASCGDGGSTAENTEDSQPATTAPASYPLEVCVVSGEKLGSMGKPFVIQHEGTEVRFCCDSCLPEFNANPDKFLAMVKAGKVEHSGQSGHKNH